MINVNAFVPSLPNVFLITSDFLLYVELDQPAD